MAKYYDDLETRAPEQREDDLAVSLPATIARAQKTKTMGLMLEGVVPADITRRSDLAGLPVIRKSELSEAQCAHPPFGGFTATPPDGFHYIFQSPGPIYEPGRMERDWWRLGRFLHAAGVGRGDIVQNCFGYHLTPAGMMFDSAARAVDAAVIPAGTGQSELQVRAAVDIGATCYAGTPDYLQVLLERADAMGETLGISKAVVGGGALFPTLRQAYADRGISTWQCYATADLGNIAYESQSSDGMIVDEGVIVEIVRPGTGDVVPAGEVGEVVVTSLNPDYPLIRFATGDLSAILPGVSDCGRTNMRIKGWMGRADQTTKIKGMFVRPEQVASFVSRHAEVARARVIADREGEMDVMVVQVESRGGTLETYQASAATCFKLKSRIEVVPVGSLPNDGKVIEDRRRYE